MFSLTFSSLMAQPLTGIKTINPAGSGIDNFTSFAAAIGAINAFGTGSGGVTFQVAAGSVFYEAQNYIQTTTSNAADQIIFIKEGIGANPIIYGKVIAGNELDAIIGVSGSDYITFDGIDLISDPAAGSDANRIEYGVGIYNNGSNGCDHITIRNCQINIERRSDGTSQNGINVWQDAGVASGIISNLLIDNVAFTGGRNAININAQNLYNESIEIRNCRFGEEASIIEPLDYGALISLNRFKNFSFHDNEIQNIVTTNFYLMQMNSFSGENYIFNNEIHNLRSTSTSEASDIMVISPYSTDASSIMYICNNLIYDIDGSKISSTAALNTYWNLAILYINGAAKYRIYNNTIVGTSVNQHENTILCWATANSEIKNNIFADFSATGENSYRSLFLSSGIIENNLFWIDESLPNNYTYRSGNTNYTFREWQKWTTIPSPGYYLNNISANPNFTDKSNFIFTMEDPSPASNSGMPLDIVTSSLNGTPRNASAPDIGAYEGDFGPATDLLPPVIRFQPIPHNSLSEVKLTAEITDNVGVSAANLWFRIKGSSDGYVKVAGNQFGNVWEFTFPAMDPGAYEYFVCAKDASDNIISNGYIISGFDTENTGLEVNNPPANQDYVYSFSYKMTLGEGTYTVGAGGDYESLTQPGGLFDAIRSSLITGNIEAEIISDLQETGEISLLQWEESGAGNYTVTVKPNSATFRTITNITTRPILIAGADRFTIDGSYEGDNLIHLAIESYSTNPLSFNSISTNGCSNITLKYFELYASAACLAVTGNYHSDFIIENINAVKGTSGISLSYVSSPVIRHCTFGNTNVTSTLSYRALYLNQCTDITVENNTIRNVINAADNLAAYGIWINNSDGGNVRNNLIEGIINNSIAGSGTSNGLCAISTKNITISNNIISGVNGYGSPNYTGNTGLNLGIQGVVLYNCDNVKFYYNTVNLYGEGNEITDGECYALSTENSVKLEIRNNIFSNTIDNANTSYTMGVMASNETSNIYKNNIYYVGGSKAFYLPFWIINSYYDDFPEWRSEGFTPGNGRDLGSGFEDPSFFNREANDVHLSSFSPAINSGMPLSVTTDFYGNPRDPVSPDIGAVEDNSLALSVDVIPPVIEFTPIPSSLNTSPELSVTITDNAGVTAAKLWYRVQGSTDAFTSVDGVKQGDDITWTFSITTPLIVSTGYEYFICAKDASDNIITNGISNTSLSATTVGLTDNAPQSHPLFVRSFKVEELSISIGTIAGSPFYISPLYSAQVNVPYTYSGTYGSGNTFTAYLSDKTGDFTAETPIGSVMSGTGTTYEGEYSSVGHREHPTAGIIPFNTILPIYEINSNTVHKNQTGDFPGYGLDITLTGETMEVGGVTVYKCDLQITGMPDPSDMGVYDTFEGAPMNYYNPTTKVFELYYFYNIAAPRKIRETNSRINDTGNIIEGTISSSTPPGTGYKIRIKSSSPSGIISDHSSDFEIRVEDITPPTVTLYSDATTPVFAAFPITIRSSEEVVGFTQSMISSTNATLSSFSEVTAGYVYTVLVTPTISGTVTLKVEAGKVADLSDNYNFESNTITLSYIDLDAPRLNISAAGGVYYFNSVNTTLTFTFDQDVTGFEEGDISVVNGAVSSFTPVSSSEYTAVLTPAGQGAVYISVPDDVATSIATSEGNSASSLNLTYDSQQPGVLLGTVNGGSHVNSSFGIYIDFTEEIKGLTAGMLGVTNGTASDPIKESGTRYKVTITPVVTEGVITISFSAGLITDMADNYNTAATDLDVEVDMNSPSVVITRTSGSGSVSSTFNITLTFNEDVTGLTVADIGVTNGTADNLVAVSAMIYTADITPDLSGDVIIDLPAGAASDLAGNPNSEAFPLTISVVITDIENSEDNFLSIFPNPSTGLFKIVVNNAINQTIRIIDLNGKQVYSNILTKDVTEFDLKYLPKGAYLIQISNGKKVSVKQIILN
jgi:hypothetical protein